MPIVFNGNHYPIIPQDKLTLGEIAAVEKAIGMNFPRLRRAAQGCVCDHGVKVHLHTDDAGNQTEDTSCTSCACEAHEPDVSDSVSTAFLWVSVKRADPSVTLAQIQAFAPAELVVQDEPAAVVAPDPTEPPPSEASST